MLLVGVARHLKNYLSDCQEVDMYLHTSTLQAICKCNQDKDREEAACFLRQRTILPFWLASRIEDALFG